LKGLIAEWQLTLTEAPRNPIVSSQRPVTLTEVPRNPIVSSQRPVTLTEAPRNPIMSSQRTLIYGHDVANGSSPLASYIWT
jgi:hypothetical protein